MTTQEQINQALAKIIEKTMSGIDATITFLSEQLPDVIHQLLVWKMVYSMLTDIGVILVVAGYVYVNYLVYKWVSTSASVYDGDRLGWHIVHLFVCVLSSMVMVSWTMTYFDFVWLQILVAPKIYLIEYGASLIK